MYSYVARERSKPFSDTPSRLASFLLSLSFTIVFCYVSPRAIFAQADDSADDVVRIRTDLVAVPTIVTDPRGRRVAGLTQSEFYVRDNGRDVTVSYFASGTERVALAFALDASGSIREAIAQQREAALKLFSRFGTGSRVAVMHFGEKATLTSPFTTDAVKAQTAFNASQPLDRHTAIFDSVAVSVRSFRENRSDPSERRIVILISDGLDTASSVRATSVINEAREVGVSIYVIHLPLYAPSGEGLAVRPPSKGFRDLAEKTGGRYFMVGDAKAALDPQTTPDLGPVFQAIEEDLRAQYVLGYYPDDASRTSAAHLIEVTLKDRSKRKLRVATLRNTYSLRP